MDILGAEIVANPKDEVVAEGFSVDRQKDFSLLLALEAPQEETRGCTTQCILLLLFRNIWCAMQWLLNCSCDKLLTRGAVPNS